MIADRDKLNGDQFKRLVKAILGSYSRFQLEDLLLTELDKYIDHIVSRNANDREAVFMVIKTAQQEDWLLRFVEVAHKNRSANENLKILYTELQPTAGVVRTTTIRLTGVQYRRLAEAIVSSYGWYQLEELLLFELDKRMEDMISRDANYRKAVEEVIYVAQQEGWLLRFTEVAHENRSADSNLRVLYTELQQLTEAGDAAQPVIEAGDVDPYEVRFLRKNWAVVDRQDLRQALKRLFEDESRILVVDGHPVSGKTYTVQLISFLKERLAASFKMAWVDLSSLAQAAGDKQISPIDIGEAITSQWGLTGMPRPQEEQEARWVMQFCNWLTGKLGGSDTNHWVMIDHFDKALLKQGAHDLIDALANRVYTTLPMLRLVLLSYKDVSSLQSIVAGGDVEYEFIPPIGEEELTVFFVLEYEDRRKRLQIPYSTNDIVTSVAQVMRRVDPNSPRRLECLREAIAAEATKLAG